LLLGLIGLRSFLTQHRIFYTFAPQIRPTARHIRQYSY